MSSRPHQVDVASQPPAQASNAESPAVESPATPMWASMSVRNFRLYFIGGIVSNTGTWAFRVAQSWLVLTKLTENSSTALGLVTGLQFLPLVFLSPYAGALADRFRKRHILTITQTANAVLNALLAILTLAGIVQLWQVFVLALLQGCIDAFDNPTRQAFASEMVGAELLPNAVGLNSASFNGARLMGPGVAGLAIAAVGEGWVFAFNAVSYLAVVWALWVMRESELHLAPRRETVKGAVREGLGYIAKRPDILMVMFIAFMVGTFGMNFQLTNALMATSVFHMGAESYGLLGSVMAVGSMTAALWAAKRRVPRMMILVGALAGFTVSVTALALSPSYLVYCLLLVLVGFFAMTALTTANARVQLSSSPRMRGRVMALYGVVFMGGTPLGAPLVGWIGDVYGARWTQLIGAVAVGATVVVVLVWHAAKRRREADPEPGEADHSLFERLPTH
jgi:MFS family permease